MSTGSSDTTIIGPDTQLRGDVATNGDLIIQGYGEGNTNVDGMLTLSNTSRWKGNLRGMSVVVSGSVEGNIVAQQRLEIRAGARVYGNLTCPRICIQRGAVVNGRLASSETAPERHEADPARRQAVG